LRKIVNIKNDKNVNKSFGIFVRIEVLVLRMFDVYNMIKELM